MALRNDATTTAHADEALAINARDVAFDWTDVPLEYIPGESFATHFWNVMHLVLPEGERAMADVFAQAMPKIADERLREELLGFVGQEAMHASSHEGFRMYLKAGGYDVDKIARTVAYLVDQVFGDHGLTGRAGEFWLNERLGIYAAAEHFTATVGEWLIDNTAFENANMDPTMLDLLRWHGAEEVEHRSVAFDVYQHLDGSYARRMRTAFIASGGLLVLWLHTVRFMYRSDSTVARHRPWPWEYFKANRKHLIPGMEFVLREIPQYLRPKFHPSQMGSIDKAVRYLAQSAAVTASS